MRVLFYISLIGLLFFGCTKAGKNISVKGRVYNPITNEGIPNIEIKLLKEKLSLSGGNEDVKTLYTDANGYYELDHASVGTRYISCFLDNDLYYRIGWIREGENEGISAVEVSKGKFTYLDYQVVPYGKLILNIQNINCEGSTDTMVFRAKGQFDTDHTSWSALKRIGCYTYISPPPYATFPMGYRYYEMKVVRPSGVTYVHDTVFIPKTGVAQVDLFY